jgi:hypothetical protein
MLGVLCKRHSPESVTLHGLAGGSTQGDMATAAQTGQQDAAAAQHAQHANEDDTGDADCGDDGAELVCVDAAADREPPETERPLTAAAMVAHVRFEEASPRSNSNTSNRTISVNSPTDSGAPTIVVTPPEANAAEEEEEVVDLLPVRDALDYLDSVAHSRDSEFEPVD